VPHERERKLKRSLPSPNPHKDHEELMEITDAQIHLWSVTAPPLPEGASHRWRLRCDEAMSLMDDAGVDRAVLIAPMSAWEHDHNGAVLEAATRYPERFAVMGRVDLDAADTVDFFEWKESPGILGIRLSDEQLLVDGGGDWIWPAAASASLPVMVFAPGRTAAIEEKARTYPELQVIVDHLNLAVGAKADSIGPTIEALMPLADLPNVAVKLSALPCYVSEPFPFPTLHPHLQRIIGGFGAERCLWGSDLTRLPCSYGDWVRTITEAASYLSEHEKALIMGGSLAEWLGWPVSR
jgi:L-fuconolactonase